MNLFYNPAERLVDERPALPLPVPVVGIAHDVGNGEIVNIPGEASQAFLRPDGLYPMIVAAKKRDHSGEFPLLGMPRGITSMQVALTGGGQLHIDRADDGRLRVIKSPR